MRCARAIAVAALLLGARCPHAAEWFVSTTGSDSSGTGSLAAPFRTIGHVLDPSEEIVAAGDTVTLRGSASSAYEECDVRLRVPLTLRSYLGERARIHCDIGVVDSVAVQIDPDASGSTLSGLDISGGYYYGVFLQTDWYQGGGEAEKGASNVLLEDLIVHASGRDAIKITPHCDHVTIRRSEIFASGAIYPPGTPLDDKNAEGIDNVNGSAMRVEDSYIHDIATTGVYFKGGASDVIVQRNRIERTGAAGILIGFDTSPEYFDLTTNPQYFEAIRGIVRNNLVQHTGYAGIGLYASLDAIVANNTIVDSANLGHAALYFGVTLQDYEPQAGRPANRNPRIRNNLVIQHGGDCMRVRWSDELGGLSGLVGSPNSDYNGFRADGACVFADGRPGSPLDAGGDLAAWSAWEHTDLHSFVAPFVVDASGHLPMASPAIDAGTVDPAVSDDRDRDPRFAPYDIGADEVRPDLIFSDDFEA